MRRRHRRHFLPYRQCCELSLKFDGAVGTVAINPTVTFDGGDGGLGVLDLTGLSGGLTNFHAVVSGFDEGEGIKIAGAASASLNGTVRR